MAINNEPTGLNRLQADLGDALVRLTGSAPLPDHRARWGERNGDAGFSAVSSGDRSTGSSAIVRGPRTR